MKRTGEKKMKFIRNLVRDLKNGNMASAHVAFYCAMAIVLFVTFVVMGIKKFLFS
jgi:hypothetical protein